MVSMKVYRAASDLHANVGIGSHWTADMAAARRWLTPLRSYLVSATVCGAVITAADLDAAIDEPWDGPLADAAWEPDWIEDHIGDAPDGVAPDRDERRLRVHGLCARHTPT